MSATNISLSVSTTESVEWETFTTDASMDFGELNKKIRLGTDADGQGAAKRVARWRRRKKLKNRRK